MRLATVRRTGVLIHTAAVDVTDLAALANALHAARARLPPLRGVFHAAGVRDDTPIVALSPLQIARVLAPKVEGARHLDALTEADPSTRVDAHPEAVAQPSWMLLRDAATADAQQS